MAENKQPDQNRNKQKGAPGRDNMSEEEKRRTSQKKGEKPQSGGWQQGS